jgi:serine/threonine protein kinase/Flp pilus assembly protein TadD
MEFIDGVTLRVKIHREQTELKKLLRLLQQVAEGLSKAHAAGIVHRDLKPENIMITRDGFAKVLDFGLAKLVEKSGPGLDQSEGSLAPTEVMPQHSVPGIVMGTVGYMSPEQAQGKIEIDQRSDIFSFGCILFEAVTGKKPFEGDSVIKSLHSLIYEPAPQIRDLNPAAPFELQRIVGRCLEKDADERFQTIKDVVIELKHLRREMTDAIDMRARESLSKNPEASMRTGTDRSPDPSSDASLITEPASAPSTQTSSIGYVVTGLKRHKLAAFLSLIFVAAVIFGFAVYRRATDSETRIGSIAVMPFVNASGNGDVEYLSDGITETLIGSLSQLPNLNVKARSSVFRYKGKEANAQTIGKELNVQAILNGRVVQRGDQLTLSLELIDAQTENVIWSEQYNRKLVDVFAVQAEIAKEISEKLRAKLSGAERQQLAKRPTENLKAFQYYTQGLVYSHRRTREDLLTAIRYYEQAIEEDRNYALPYAGVANAYASLGLYGYIAPSEGRRKAEDAARKSLALDENLAEAHTVLGQIYVHFTPYSFSLGDRELRHAIELSPSLALAHWYLGISLVFQGRLDEAREELLKARELDPLSPVIARSLAIPYYFKRDYARALERLREANELGPPFGTTFEIGVYIQNRLFNETLAELEKAKQERKNDPILIYGTGMIYAARGERAEALQVIKELEQMSGESLSQAHWIAKIYATLDEKELALAWLDRGLAAGMIGSFYKDEPVWDPIRSDARFGDLLRRMGLPE